MLYANEGILPSDWLPLFTFPETQFVTVTRYYNETVIKMKIKNNPFGQGLKRKGKPLIIQ